MQRQRQFAHLAGLNYFLRGTCLGSAGRFRWRERRDGVKGGGLGAEMEVWCKWGGEMSKSFRNCCGAIRVNCWSLWRNTSQLKTSMVQYKSINELCVAIRVNWWLLCCNTSQLMKSVFSQLRIWSILIALCCRSYKCQYKTSFYL